MPAEQMPERRTTSQWLLRMHPEASSEDGKVKEEGSNEARVETSNTLVLELGLPC